MDEIRCCICKADLEKNHIALCKKLLGRTINKYMCLSCLAEYIECTEQDLLIKIEEFKEQGCTLFG